MRWCLLVCLSTLSLLNACGRQVGDACTTNTACGAGLICDLSVADGYCTMTPCRAGECPEGAVCVDFGTEASWCMRRCDQEDTCRDGLACISPTQLPGSTCLDPLASCQFCGVP